MIADGFPVGMVCAVRGGTNNDERVKILGSAQRYYVALGTRSGKTSSVYGQLVIPLDNTFSYGRYASLRKLVVELTRLVPLTMEQQHEETEDASETQDPSKSKASAESGGKD